MLLHILYQNQIRFFEYFPFYTPSVNILLSYY
nr:MAG TPA: hypothetical protein [Bacteriophage sp.]